MQFLVNLVHAAQLVSAVVIILLVLVQHGKGADMGAAFGSGASGTLFGATGSSNALSRATAIAATLFFVCTLALAYFSNLQPGSGSANEGLLSGSAPAASAPASAAVGGVAAIPGATPAALPAASAASQP